MAVVVEGMDGAISGTDTPTPAPYATYLQPGLAALR